METKVEPVAEILVEKPIISVPGKSWDPSDPSLNNNSDQPVYIPPVHPERKSYNPILGREIFEGGGESRPMFSSSLKEI